MKRFDQIIEGLVENKIQLLKVQLVEMSVHLESAYDLKDIREKLSIQLSNGSRIINENNGETYLEVRMSIEEETSVPLEINIKYTGQCRTDALLSEEDFKAFLEYQSIPLLWPYIRQGISDTMAKMSIPPILLPTIDVIVTLRNRYSDESKGN